MKNVRSTFALLFSAILVISLQYCAVDPLDVPEGGDLSGTTGYTLCSDKTLKDSDSDGVNDDCEKLLGTDPNTKDSDGDGIPDPQDMPQNQPTQVCPPTSQDQALINYCGGIQAMQNQLLNDTANSSLLANSGLNQAAPVGTKVTVAAQSVRIVYEGKGVPDADATEVCKKDNIPFKNFVFYKISGDVVRCLDEKCDPSTPMSKATMWLCHEITGTSTDYTLTNISSIKIPSFSWSAGKADNFNALGKHVVMPFDPKLLRGSTTVDSSTLTIKPSNEQLDVYQKMNLTFENSFKIYGTITEGEFKGDVIETKEEIITSRNFKRTFTTTSDTKNTMPGLTGIWQAD